MNKWVFGLISVLILAVIPGLSRAEAQPCRTVTVVAGTSSGDRAVAISGVIETLRAAGFQVTTPEAQRSIAQLQGRGNRVPLYTTCRYLFVKVVNIREERGTALDLAIPIRVSRSTRIGNRIIRYPVRTYVRGQGQVRVLSLTMTLSLWTGASLLEREATLTGTASFLDVRVRSRSIGANIRNMTPRQQTVGNLARAITVAFLNPDSL